MSKKNIRVFAMDRNFLFTPPPSRETVNIVVFEYSIRTDIGVGTYIYAFDYFETG